MTDNLLKPLILDPDPNQAEAMLSVIKSAGYAVRPASASNLEEFEQQLRQDGPDLVIASLDRLDFGLSDVIAQIEHAGRRIPVIVVLEAPPADISDYLEAGAEDVIAAAHPTHFQHAVKRAAQAQASWRQLKRAEAALLEAEKRCQTLLASSRDAIAYVADGMHVFANQTYLDLFGFTDFEEIEGLPLLDMVAREDRDQAKALLRDFKGGHEQTHPLKLQTAQGHTLEVEMTLSPAMIEGEACTQIVFRPRIDSADYEEKLNYLSQRDLMTGLYNRQYFLDRLKEATSRASQGEGNGALIHIVPDRFEQLKETFGIAGSDLILADFGKLLEETIGEGDIASRFEAHRFTVLTRTWESEALQAMLDDWAVRFGSHIYELNGRSVSTSVTLGAAIIDENSPDPNELLTRAERAYKQALAAGGARAQIYRPREGEMTQRQLDQVWSERLRNAIKQGRLRLLFQPIVSLHGETRPQYNVFMRMLDERGQPVAAREFMPSAERSGVARMLDRWVIRTAIERLAAAPADTDSPTLFIKLTAGTLQDPEMLPWLAEQLKKARISGERLAFEIKTDIAVNYLRQSRELLKGLHQLRSRLALDGFGSVANPFQLLKQVPAEFLKLDGSLMDDLATSPEIQETIKSITSQAHAESRLVIAQRVENASEMSILWNLGVNYVQGNFIGLPSERMDFDFSSMG